ncbi:iron chelate uptake ABC transporter family permease subunit [Devosia sp. Naph2]|uniref:iron chelate uptake ABC transporter family permease subunit n=1 Tax=Devosia polycyclovorans TaxID=3345148 RepID=UPI0035CF3769
MPERSTSPGLAPRQVLIILTALAAVLITAFMVIGAKGSWGFVLPFRGTKVWGIAMVGGAIAVATVLFQTITANRILTPAIMGYDALFRLVRTVQIFFLGGLSYATLNVQLQFAFETVLMVGLSTLLFRWLFNRAARDLYLLVLVGIVFGVLFRSLAGLMQRLINPNDYAVLQDVMFAGFNTIDKSLLMVSTLAILGSGVWVWRLLPALDVLNLGRDNAINLGVAYRSVVSQVLIIIAILVSVSTALVGPVTFFGLLVSNLAYMLIRSHKHALILPAAVLLAIIALIGGQVILERVFGFDSALAIIIEFVGGVVFIAMLLKGNRK